MKVLFTGSKGLIASWVVPYLEEYGIEVDGYDIKNGDDFFDKEKLVSRMKDCDAVIHMAAIPHYKVHGKVVPKETMFKVNLEGTRAVAEATKEVGIKRLIFTSSGATYGYDEGFKPTKFPIEVDDFNVPYEDLNFYAQSKRDCEKMLKEEYSKFFDVLVFRMNGINGIEVLSKPHYFHYVTKENQGKAYLNGLMCEAEPFEIFNICEPYLSINLPCIS